MLSTVQEIGQRGIERERGRETEDGEGRERQRDTERERRRETGREGGGVERTLGPGGSSSSSLERCTFILTCQCVPSFRVGIISVSTGI